MNSEIIGILFYILCGVSLPILVLFANKRKVKSFDQRADKFIAIMFSIVIGLIAVIVGVNALLKFI